jgi:hypothetical protein
VYVDNIASLLSRRRRWSWRPDLPALPRPRSGAALHRGGVDDVVLAAATGGEFRYPGGRGARHIVDLFAAGGLPLDKVSSQAAGGRSEYDLKDASQLSTRASAK